MYVCMYVLHFRLFYRWYSALLAAKETAAGSDDPTTGVPPRPKSSMSRIRGGHSSSDDFESSGNSNSRKSVFAVKEAILLEGAPTSPMKGLLCMYVCMYGM